ncbi:SDR family oxidoreductase [uncultured Roseobacter sp.]|uniref:SDR family oxidoreductase n=1 Tax=uncultured Roseobacter sp. TaxID=114847 RepID=UPI002639E456|nr:SDR family oxidoreductase [uncultured Roseobacter sp.]
MKIVVVGAAGAIGSKLVGQRLENGQAVTGVVRKTEQAETLRHAGAAASMADLASVDALTATFEGHDAIVFVAGSKGKALDDVDRDGAINSAKVAEAAGVKRFVLLSSIYAGRADEGPDALRAYFHAKHIADGFIKGTGLDYTIIRPSFLTDEAPTGLFEVAEAFDGMDATITRDDVATLFAAAIDAPSTSRQTLEVINGEVPANEALQSPFPSDTG